MSVILLLNNDTRFTVGTFIIMITTKTWKNAEMNGLSDRCLFLVDLIFGTNRDHSLHKRTYLQEWTSDVDLPPVLPFTVVVFYCTAIHITGSTIMNTFMAFLFSILSISGTGNLTFILIRNEISIRNTFIPIESPYLIKV